MATGSGQGSYQQFADHTRPRFLQQSLHNLLKAWASACARVFRYEDNAAQRISTERRTARGDYSQRFKQPDPFTFADVATGDVETTQPGVAAAEGDEMSLLECPRDGSTMLEVVRDEVLIDVCPKCRGVWLDRGELEKLMARVHLPDDANIYERKESGKRQRPSLQDFFN